MSSPTCPPAHAIALGGGCFWCIEAVFKAVRGVLDVQSGYSNGQVERPTYEQVCTGQTGCAEVVLLHYDSAIIATEHVLEIFFFVHDPTQLNGQGPDLGSQYRSCIFTTREEQRSEALQLIASLQKSNSFSKPIVTQVAPLANYWPAENYHQNFFEKNPTQGYCLAHAAPKVAKLRRAFAQWTKD